MAVSFAKAPEDHSLGKKIKYAQMAELVYAPVLGTGSRKGLEVRVLFWAHKFNWRTRTGRGRETGVSCWRKVLKTVGFQGVRLGRREIVLFWAPRKIRCAHHAAGMYEKN